MHHGCAEPGTVFPDWEKDFGRKAPLELEIGPGRGAFALDHAAAHPEIDLVIIETRRSDCELIAGRASRRALRNLMIIHGDAKLLVPRMFAPGSLSAIHVQFPDPWWKTKHHKRRMVDVDLAVQMRTLLAPGGLVDFRTDVPAYAEEGNQTWLDAGFTRLPDEPEPEVLSTRERRYKITGQPVFRARFVNPGGDVRVETDRTGRDWRDQRRK